MARDLVLVHGNGSEIERGTRDVDFAISVHNWVDFNNLRNAMLASGYSAHKKLHHSFEFRDSKGLPWEVDIVPFGDIAENHMITWPPEHDFQMSVPGFPEALGLPYRYKFPNPQMLLSLSHPQPVFVY